MATWVTGARTINCYTDKDVTWYSLMRVAHSAACLALATYVKVKRKQVIRTLLHAWPIQYHVLYVSCRSIRVFAKVLFSF